ncbi:hypothetical protein [Sphingomonas colocasiae]|uniref:Uncharacterized protein n=1 Tax=Sphingomonas colocasiae TaxID=1848973 RepID=A0ABS7PK61_9SPHN|nr:hypothetical protein [Sphingomonas colocasiae]MBY8821675.1 hypothetical protein [Sphingomonas colocasiae]
MDMPLPDTAEALRARLTEQGVALPLEDAEAVWRDWQVILTFRDAMRADEAAAPRP